MKNNISLLETMQLAKIDKKLASKYIKNFVENKFNLDLLEVKINPSAVSLNSVNWFIVYRNWKQDFFKFHSEEWEEILVWEYYRAWVLEKAWFDVISPKYESSKSWEQFLIYKKIEDPTLYDYMWEIDKELLECKKLKRNKYYQRIEKVCLPIEDRINKILKAEKQLNNKCIEIAKKTLKIVSNDKVENESIWQLFYWRLESDKSIPRIDLFYKNKDIILVNWNKINFEEFKNYNWVINWRKYKQSLKEIIFDAKQLLNPKNSKNWPVITAHGDDHNWNKFFRNNWIIQYFDPAFASENIPALLAFIKTTYHDVFAHPLYLYEPKSIEKYLQIEFKIDLENKQIIVDNNFSLEEHSPFRKELLELKFKTLWKPLINLLKEKNLLIWNEKEFIKKALFCCPFLAVNLINSDRYSPQVSILAMSIAIELWTSSIWEVNEIDNLIDSVL